MNPGIASILCLAFVGYCLRRDLKNTTREDAILWLPSLFLLNIGARPPSMWLNPYAGDKSAVDTAINVGFFAVGLFVCMRKGAERPRLSGALLAFLAFCGLSLLWSEGGLQAGKQYIKMLGMLVMALVVASHPDQLDALTKIFRRAAYVLVPISFLFVKYYVDLGVRYDEWTGRPMYIGVTAHKNLLGQVCLLIALVLASSLIARLREGVPARERWEMWFDAGLVALTSHLLWRYADSATSELCLIVGVAVAVILSRDSIRRNIGWWLIGTSGLIMIAQVGFGLSAMVAEAVGRDETMSNRTLIWQEVLRHVVNPWIGAGFEGFWTDPVRIAAINESFSISSAHSGYLEIYLGLGLIGLVLFVAVLLSMYRRCRFALDSGSAFGRTALAIWIAVILHNVTESGWRGLSVMLFIALWLATQRTAAPSPATFELPAVARLRTAGTGG